MTKKWLAEKIVTREIAISMFIDLLIANCVSIALISFTAFAHGGIYLVIFFIGLWLTSMTTATYAKAIFPKKRRDKNADNN